MSRHLSLCTVIGAFASNVASSTRRRVWVRRFFWAAMVLLLFMGIAACSPSKPSSVSEVAPPSAGTSQQTTQTATQTGTGQTSPTPTGRGQGSPPNVSGTLEAHFLDVGQGDCCYIRLPDGSNMLIYAGSIAAKDIVVRYLKDAGVSKIDYLAFTHPHEDHIGGGTTVLSEFEVRNVFMPRTGHTTQTYEDLLLAIDGKGLSITEAKAGKVILEKPGLKVYFCSPVKSYEDLNDWSAVVAITYGRKTFLFMGDASSVAESDMLAHRTIPDCDVIKVGHHGSSSSTSIALLETSKPEYAVISVGANNPYGHPSPDVLERLSTAGARIYRTDLNGTVVISTEGREIVVKVEREQGQRTASGTITPVPIPPRSTQDASSITVCITATGSKYHTASCRYLSKSKIPISLKDARARGYTPCSVCNPPR